MSITQLLIIATVAALVGRLGAGRSPALLGVSTFFIYWLQPAQDPVTLTFWLPTATLVVTIFVWLLTSTPEVRGWKQNLPAVAVLLGVVLLVDLNRYLQFQQALNMATPRPQWLGALILAVLFFAFLITRFRYSPRALLMVATLGLIVLFVLVKVPSLLSVYFEKVSAVRGKGGSGFSTLAWLGFSYVAFRLLHTLLDRNAGRLPPVLLGDYLNYVIFFPSFTAGPLDRLERFTRDLRHPLPMDVQGWEEAASRFVVGVFKKFVIADALAWIALNDVFVQQIRSPLWMWLLLYCYSLRIYFDFSGYTDIAIGLGRVLGVRLPENFASPYLKPNLTQFWNSWHMTLTQWFRSYFFNPLTRGLRSRPRPVPVLLVILVTQTSTMLLIGLWHGITAGFVLWGLWHGAGLFLQNRWSDYVRGRLPSWAAGRAGQAVLRYSGVFLTFNFVSLSWLFFTLPTPKQAWSVMAVLFGVR